MNVEPENILSKKKNNNIIHKYNVIKNNKILQ
jgi:hypothetical protein